MSSLFLQVLNMSMTGSIVILLVMIARLALKRFPKIFSYGLWSVVLFRLLCPVAIPAPVSVLEVMEPEMLETSENISTVSYIPKDIQMELKTDFVAVQPENSVLQQEEESGGELEFFTDAPPGTDGAQVQRKHYFFRSDFGNTVYDMWFDLTVADPEVMREILKSVDIGHDGVYTRELDYPQSQKIRDFQLTVPKGYGYKRTADRLLEIHKPGKFEKADTVVAGVTVRRKPDFEPEEGNMMEWAVAAGISYDPKTDSYSISDDTQYGDLTLSLDDLHDGEAVLDTVHYFYILGNQVYDLWFDELYIKENVKQEILDSIEWIPQV